MSRRSLFVIDLSGVDRDRLEALVHLPQHATAWTEARNDSCEKLLTRTNN